jgi:tRNA(His) guanylyltransferase
MDSSEFERRMRALESYHTLRVPPETWLIVRVDGRSFSRLTTTQFAKPFDEHFHDYMLQTAEALLRELHALYVYTESDEISILCSRTWDFFDREVEKIVSVSAAIASGTFTLATQAAVQFDSRICVAARDEQVVDYFRWRQEDATRHALNGWCYWTLRQDGQSVREATDAMERLSVAAKHEILFQHGVNFNEVPAWQRRGTGLHWQHIEKAGYDPVHQRATVTTRRRPLINDQLPMKDAYSTYIQHILDEANMEREE